MEDEPGFYWIKQSDGFWIVQELRRNDFDKSELEWMLGGMEGPYPEPMGDIGPRIEPPEYVVEFPGGTTHGPFTETQALVYAAKQYPGSGCKVKKQ